MAEESFKERVRLEIIKVADGKCTLGFVESGKSGKSRPKSLIKGNELVDPKSVDLVLRKKSGTEFFDEIVIGNESALCKYRKLIENDLAICLK